MNRMHLEGIDVALANAEPRDSEVRKAERKKDERSFYVLFVLSFPLFLIAALIGRLIASGAESTAANHVQNKSVIAEASAAARSTIAIALTS
jgi:hypothetical protein